ATPSVLAHLADRSAEMRPLRCEHDLRHRQEWSIPLLQVHAPGEQGQRALLKSESSHGTPGRSGAPRARKPSTRPRPDAAHSERSTPSPKAAKQGESEN